jgi:hypothetical protein
VPLHAPFHGVEHVEEVFEPTFELRKRLHEGNGSRADGSLL